MFVLDIIKKPAFLTRRVFIIVYIFLYDSPASFLCIKPKKVKIEAVKIVACHIMFVPLFASKSRKNILN